MVLQHIKRCALVNRCALICNLQSHSRCRSFFAGARFKDIGPLRRVC